MKINLSEALQKSLEEEQTIAKDKLSSLESRFSKAEIILSDNPQPTNKVLREVFTIPLEEHSLIPQTQKRLINLGYAYNKSEIVRMGLACLAYLTEEDLLNLSKRILKIKVGRPITHQSPEH